MARLWPFLLIAFAASAQPMIVDTDGGSDDLMAIAFLLAHPTVSIEAITVANGLVHVDAGARNIVRLLELAGRPEIPVFVGRATPLRGNNEFPAEWRKASDELPGVTLPRATRQPAPKPAADYLIERLRDKQRPVRILALGPLTNVAAAMKRQPRILPSIREIVIMGGAIGVPGNLGDGNLFKNGNKTAEWNIFVDPLAARIVFRSGVPIRVVGLDATNKVPVDLKFLKEFKDHAHSPLGRFVSEVLETDRGAIEGGFFYAWDPLAAVALLHPTAVRSLRMHIEVQQDAPAEGRTVRNAGRPNAQVAMDADPALFRRVFLAAFEK